MYKIVISGIEPSNFGDGQLMKRIFSLANQKSYKCVFKRTNLFKQFVSQKRYFDAIIHLIKIFIDAIIFIKNVWWLKNARILIIDPQRIGYIIYKRILKRNSIIAMYVTDNSYFCIQSQNYLTSEESECFRCLKDLNDCHETCKPSLVKYKKKKNLYYLEFFKLFAHKIEYFVQSESQKKLLHQFYGHNIDVKIVGLDFGEVKLSDLTFKRNIKRQQNLLVYVGALQESIGIKYVLQLASFLRQYTILIPFSKNEVATKYPDFNYQFLLNLKFEENSQEKNFKEYVQKAALVLCPSRWSATADTDLIKSLAFNGNVAVFDTEFGFQKDIPDDLVLRLNKDLQQSANRIIGFVENKNDKTEIAHYWLKNYLENCDLTKLFFESSFQSTKFTTAKT